MSGDRHVFLAINRSSGLKPFEKVLLAESVTDEMAFRSLKRVDVERLIGRRFIKADWKPESALRFAEEDEKNLTGSEIKCTFYWEESYPPQLREIYDPPYVLFYRGILPDYGKPMIAVVGTRYPTGRGINAAFQFGLSLGRCNLPVVSGLARGIDCAAHQGNIAGGGRTVAVLGNGIDQFYPVSSRSVGRDILVKDGCVISEYAPGMPPLKHHFPNRNRIISGLSRSTVVIEAPEKSGALITADYALEHGRDLFIHRDGTFGSAGAGCRSLANDGARIITSAGEILDEWGIESAAPDNDAYDERELTDMLEAELGSCLAKYNGEIY